MSSGMLLPNHVSQACHLQIRHSDSLTGSSTYGINVTKHQQVFWLLSFDIIPSVSLIVMQQLIFPDPIGVKKICYSDIVFVIDRGVITNRQWPVIVWASEWSPDTDLSMLSRGDTSGRSNHSLDDIIILVRKMLFLPWKRSAKLKHRTSNRIVAMWKTCRLFVSNDGQLI